MLAELFAFGWKKILPWLWYVHVKQVRCHRLDLLGMKAGLEVGAAENGDMFSWGGQGSKSTRFFTASAVAPCYLLIPPESQEEEEEKKR